MSNSLTGGPMPSTLNELSSSSNDENNEGIPFSQIPSGSENLYVLKSKIVPPVCPRCPDIDMKKIKAELEKQNVLHVLHVPVVQTNHLHAKRYLIINI